MVRNRAVGNGIACCFLIDKVCVRPCVCECVIIVCKSKCGGAVCGCTRKACARKDFADVGVGSKGIICELCLDVVKGCAHKAAYLAFSVRTITVGRTVDGHRNACNRLVSRNDYVKFKCVGELYGVDYQMVRYRTVGIYCVGRLQTVDKACISVICVGVSGNLFAENLALYEVNRGIYAVGNSRHRHGCAASKVGILYGGDVESFAGDIVIAIEVECCGGDLVDIGLALGALDYYVADAAYGVIGYLYNYPAGNGACKAAGTGDVHKVVSVICYLVCRINRSLVEFGFNFGKLYFLGGNALTVNLADYSVESLLICYLEERVAYGQKYAAYQ